MLNCLWPKAPLNPVLANDEVHIWCIDLDDPVDDAGTMPGSSHLSGDEQARAARFRFERVRRRFIAGRGQLRMILGRYLNLSPGELKFKYLPAGKPELMDEESLRFNLSNSEGTALVAVTRNLEVGIDLESIHPFPDLLQVAQQFFAQSERVELEALPADQRLEVFFRVWTRKEAYLKARGDGLSTPLDQFSVSLAPETPSRLLTSNIGPAELSRWVLHTLTPIPGFTGTLAVEGQSVGIVHWRME